MTLGTVRRGTHRATPVKSWNDPRHGYHRAEMIHAR